LHPLKVFVRRGGAERFIEVVLTLRLASALFWLRVSRIIGEPIEESAARCAGVSRIRP